MLQAIFAALAGVGASTDAVQQVADGKFFLGNDFGVLTIGLLRDVRVLQRNSPNSRRSPWCGTG